MSDKPLSRTDVRLLLLQAISHLDMGADVTAREDLEAALANYGRPLPLERIATALEQLAAAAPPAPSFPLYIPPDEIRCWKGYSNADGVARCVYETGHAGECRLGHPRPRVKP